MTQNETNIVIDGDTVKEVTTIEVAFDKAEYLAKKKKKKKEAELQAHDEGVKAYNDSQNEIRAELVKTIADLKK
jgi:hypothetical protein